MSPTPDDLAALLSDAEWQLDVQVGHAAEGAYADALMNLSNGHQGIRSTADPADLYAEPSFLVSGVYDTGADVGREIVNLPHPLGWRVRHGYETLRTATTARRVLDMRQGLAYLERELVNGDGDVWRLSTVTLLHAVRPEAGLMFGQLEVPEGTGEIALDLFWDNTIGNSYLGGRLPALKTFHVTADEVVIDGETVDARCTLAGTGAAVGLVSRIVCDQATGRRPLVERSRWGQVVIAAPQAGRVTFSLLWTVNGEPAAEDHLRLLEEHCAEWRRRWDEHDIRIEGDRQSQQALRFSVYNLMQHELPVSPVKLSPARGLSGTYHSGATFFDTELHKDAYWSWTDPSVALAHLMFRYQTLPAAREFARGTGFRGARFPVAADDLGQDTGPHEVLDLRSGKRFPEWNVREVLHISADVAYSVHRYYEVTGDDGFLFRYGIELLVETARFAASAFTWSEQDEQFTITSVMGPDEYHFHVTDSLFTNRMLQWNLVVAANTLRGAAERDAAETAAVFRRLGLEEPEVLSWLDIAAKVRLPASLPDGIPAQHAGYADLPDCSLRTDGGTPAPRLTADEQALIRQSLVVPSKLIKQADVVLLAHLLPELFDEPGATAVLDYYEPRTAHASSLSFAPHGVVAARSGQPDRAVHFLLRAGRYNLDYQPRSGYRNGLHLSACAGAWQVVAEGVLGVGVDGDRLVLRPHLPSAWSRLEVPLRFRGSRVLVTVTPGSTTVELISGTPVGLVVGSESATLAGGVLKFG